MAEYRRLTAQDASFLAFESDSTPMAIEAVSIYDAKPIQLPDGSLDVSTLQAHVAASLGSIATFRRKLEHVPGFGNPVWVEVDDIDVDLHLKHVALPQPGDEHELQTCAAWILTQPLERERPLWDCWIVEGLQESRFALILRVHHALLDGGSGLVALEAMHSLTPEPVAAVGSAQAVGPAPSPGELFVNEASYRAASLFLGASRVFLAASKPRDFMSQIGSLASGLVSATASLAPRTFINQPIGRERRTTWMRSDLQIVKDIKKSLGGTVNDVVLNVCAGALREYFVQRGESVEGLTLRVACPADQRKSDGASHEGNSTAGLVVDLPIYLADPVERHQAIALATRRAKADHQSQATALALDLTNQLAPGVATQILRFSSYFQNLVVSNIAGPSLPLYLMDCALLAVYPLSLLLDRTGLGITVFSYNGSLDWTFSADWEIVPEIGDLPQATYRELMELHQLTRTEAP